MSFGQPWRGLTSPCSSKTTALCMDQLDQPFASSSGSRTLDWDPIGIWQTTPKGISNDYEMTINSWITHWWLWGNHFRDISSAYPCWGRQYEFLLKCDDFIWSWKMDHAHRRQGGPENSEPSDLSWALPREAGQPFVLCQQNIVFTGYLRNRKPQSLNSTKCTVVVLSGAKVVITVLTVESKIDHSQNPLRKHV